jgi:hypothetical protein
MCQSCLARRHAIDGVGGIVINARKGGGPNTISDGGGGVSELVFLMLELLGENAQGCSMYYRMNIHLGSQERK